MKGDIAIGGRRCHSTCNPCWLSYLMTCLIGSLSGQHNLIALVRLFIKVESSIKHIARSTSSYEPSRMGCSTGAQPQVQRPLLHHHWRPIHEAGKRIFADTRGYGFYQLFYPSEDCHMQDSSTLPGSMACGIRGPPPRLVITPSNNNSSLLGLLRQRLTHKPSPTWLHSSSALNGRQFGTLSISDHKKWSMYGTASQTQPLYHLSTIVHYIVRSDNRSYHARHAFNYDKHS